MAKSPTKDQINETQDSDLFLNLGQREILRKSSLCAKLTDEQATYFFEVVERTKLDPFTGQIRPDVRSTKVGRENGEDVYEKRLLIITTLQGLRVIGDRSGQMAGESPVNWCGTNGEWHEAWLLEDPPVAARASVFRKDRPDHPQTSVCRWDAFVQEKFGKGGERIPNDFWKRMGSHMLGKCALAGAFRGAFPNQCGGLYITEELSQQIDPDSEEAVEAEMVRRARSEEAYWKEQAKNGVFPVGQGPNDQKPHQLATPALMKQLEVVRETTPAPALGEKDDLDMSPPTPHWQDLEITRIKMFKGRTVGSLTPEELEGLKVFLKMADEKLANGTELDADIVAHCGAIKARITYESQLEELNNEFDFTKR